MTGIPMATHAMALTAMPMLARTPRNSTYGHASDRAIAVVKLFPLTEKCHNQRDRQLPVAQTDILSEPVR